MKARTRSPHGRSHPTDAVTPWTRSPHALSGYLLVSTLMTLMPSMVPVEDKVSRLVKDDVCQPNAVHLLQLPLHGHPAAKLHVGQLLSHLLQLREHLRGRKSSESPRPGLGRPKSSKYCSVASFKWTEYKGLSVSWRFCLTVPSRLWIINQAIVQVDFQRK